MLLKCGRSAVRSMVLVCSHSGANNIRSSVLVELDLEVKCVGLQSQREAVNGVGLRAGGVGLGGGPTISGRACWWSWTWRRNIRGSMVSVCSHSGANNIRSSVLVGPTISGRLVGPTISGRACWWGQQYQVDVMAPRISDGVTRDGVTRARIERAWTCNGTAHK